MSEHEIRVNIRSPLSGDLMRLIGFYGGLFSELFRISPDLVQKLQRRAMNSILSHEREIIVADVAKSPVGYAAYCFGQGVTYLDHLYVMPHFRRIGVGSKLLEEVAQDSLCNSSFRICLQLNDDSGKDAAIRFYEQYGFVRDGNRMVCRDLSKILEKRKIKRFK
jgi:ribosomal protein S18 acetylase RimI-like enzyme